MTRLEINRELLNILESLIEKYPDMRFSQILLNFAFVKPERPAKPELRISWQDEFYKESSEIIERVRRRVQNIETEDSE